MQVLVFSLIKHNIFKKRVFEQSIFIFESKKRILTTGLKQLPLVKNCDESNDHSAASG